MIKRIWRKITTPQLRAWLNLEGFGKKRNSKNDALRRKILNYHKNTKDIEIKECIDFIKKYRDVYIFNYPYIFDYYEQDQEVIFDKSVGLNYVNIYGKKMYLKRKMDTDEAKKYVIGLLCEQDIRSPHRYLPEEFSFYDDEVVYDIGAAEGIFALSIVDQVKKIKLFECDPEWIEALKETFRDYENVEIVSGFVGKDKGENKIVLDEYIKENDVPTLIKMDIEGEEVSALEGMQKSILCVDGLRLCVCVYHRKDAEERVRHIIPETYKISTSDGYMLFLYDELEEPYFRRGVLRIFSK